MYSNNKMNLKSHPITLAGATLALVLSAGSALALNAGPEHKENRSATSSMSESNRAISLTLVRSSDVLGAAVVGKNNEEIGNIDDLIVDRGTGKIAHAVIGYGGLLDIGENLFATDFTNLQYSATKGRFSTGMSKEQAERHIEFLPENWEDLSQVDWMENQTNGMSDEDSKLYGRDLAASDTVEVTGTVSEIKRQETGDNEDIIVCVNDKNGDTQEVVLGPSWYIMGLDNAPSADDRVELVAAEHNGRWIATEARVSGTDINLRDRDGSVYWKSSNHKTPRYVLLSDLIGRDIEIDGSTSGEIQNAVVEASSGRVVFFGFDPNENFLGLGDDVSMIPWSALQISADLTVWSSSNATAFENAMPMPEHLDTLRTRSSVMGAYTPFGLETPSYQSTNRSMHRDRTGSHSVRTGDAWGKDSSVVKALADGDKTRLHGKFVDMDSITLNDGESTASTMWIETAEGKKVEIILGPEWYIDRQDIKLDAGDRVTISGQTAMIDGERRTAAWVVTEGESTWKLWNLSNPMWIN